MFLIFVVCRGMFIFFFFQAEDGIRDAQESRGLGDVYKRQVVMYGAASPINPSSLAPSSSTSTPRKPQTANNNISNTPKLPMLSMMHTQTATLPLSARSATAPGSNTNNNSMRLTSRQQRLVEANNKRKILKPPVTPDLPDALWEGDLTQLDTFEQVHHQLKNVTIANDDNRPLSRTAGGTLRSPTNANGGGQQTRPRLEASLGETMVPYGPNAVSYTHLTLPTKRIV
eukprot:TRINITY_DN50464_c0_g1_i1.p1 TRINITY_DN50464_c0_g1~~TRINITY_DN50464_c0_g1_i1.p1  ORF type:complete len:228 (-),score=50.61 TRINITY_DN50464_c0_g1_i1:109-792(-)